MCQIIILGLLNTTYLILNTTYQNSKKHVFESKLWNTLTIKKFYKKMLVKFRNMHRKTPVGVAGLQFYQKETPAQVFFCEYCGILKNTYFEKYLRKVSEFFLQWSLLIAVKFSAVTKIILFISGNYNRVVFRTLSNIF